MKPIFAMFVFFSLSIAQAQTAGPPARNAQTKVPLFLFPLICASLDDGDTLLKVEPAVQRTRQGGLAIAGAEIVDLAKRGSPRSVVTPAFTQQQVDQVKYQFAFLGSPSKTLTIHGQQAPLLDNPLQGQPTSAQRRTTATLRSDGVAFLEVLVCEGIRTVRTQ